MLLLCLLSGSWPFSVSLGLVGLGHHLESLSMHIVPLISPPSLGSGRLLDTYLFRIQIGNVDQKAAEPFLFILCINLL